MQIYFLDRIEADVFLQALICTGSKQSLNVISDLIGWELAHLGKRQQFALTNYSMPQLIKVLTFPNRL